MLVVVLGLVWCAAAVPAAPGYQLGEPRTNAVGIGAAAAWSAGTAFVVGGSGDETRGPGPSGAGGFVFRDSKLFQVAARSWSSLQPLPLGQQRAFHSLHQLDADRTLLFGGSRDNDFLSDLWVYSRGNATTRVFFPLLLAGGLPRLTRLTKATNLWTPLTPVAGKSFPAAVVSRFLLTPLQARLLLAELAMRRAWWAGRCGCLGEWERAECC